ncbi:hypothetical protein [Massilia niastensis]|uniref:hypothetical protein n=1 Tax=Massilia niastensis TaxID=544911 RepID=UPI0012EBCF47|nr:hypothetical protein [Massilia niastensis]
MSTRHHSARTALALLCLVNAVTAAATEFQLANLNALYTTRSKADPVLGTGTDDEHLKTYQFEYFAGFKYGDLYGSTDLIVCQSAELSQ